METVHAIRDWGSNTGVILCSVSTVLGRMKQMLMSCKNINCIILVIPQPSQMILFLHLKLALHNIKRNRRNHTNNLNCKFFFFRTTLNNKLRVTQVKREIRKEEKQLCSRLLQSRRFLSEQGAPQIR